MDFAGADLSLVSVVGREFVLKNCFSKTTKLADYDIVLLDNPPSISLVVMNSLVASDFFLVPCSAEYLPMVGLTLLSESIMKMFKVAPGLKPLGVILTLFSHNERICRQIETMLRKEVGASLFETKIRVNTKAKAAPSVHKIIFDYENSAKGRGSEDFSKLTSEFLERLRASQDLHARVGQYDRGTRWTGGAPTGLEQHRHAVHWRERVGQAAEKGELRPLAGP